jgi:hypothetical protein
MKRMTILFASAIFAVSVLAGSPALAQTVKDRTCSNAQGDSPASVTWDCGFKVKSFSPGQPITFQVGYSCSGECGPVLSFGMQDTAFTPAGVAGHLVGGSRLPDGLELTFAFDSVRKAGVSGNGLAAAHFVMNLMTTDASGAPVVVSCPVDVRLQEYAH